MHCAFKKYPANNNKRRVGSDWLCVNLIHVTKVNKKYLEDLDMNQHAHQVGARMFSPCLLGGWEYSRRGKYEKLYQYLSAPQPAALCPCTFALHCAFSHLLLPNAITKYLGEGQSPPRHIYEMHPLREIHLSDSEAYIYIVIFAQF